MICVAIRRPFRIAFIAAALAVVLAAFAGWAWYTADRTIYAKGFSQREFDQVTRGMPESEVLSRLGEPLAVDENVKPERWFYGEAPIESRPVSTVIDLFEPTQSVTFDQDGLVVQVVGESLRAVSQGMSAPEVLEKAGQPQRVTPRMVKVLHYTRASQSGLFRARMIGIGVDRTVAAVFAYEFHD